MSQSQLNNPERISTFGVEIIHSRSEVSIMPPEQTAAETVAGEMMLGNFATAEAITQATSEVGKVVRITRDTTAGVMGIDGIFTSDQVLGMQSRIHDYLGKDIDTHLRDLAAPTGYPRYIGRLAAYYASSDNSVTERFGEFEKRHTDPITNALGPREQNSREYANWANTILLRQFAEFYQAKFDITLVGPTKQVEGSRISWERGIAECQFLVLDNVRDLLAIGHTSNGPAGSESMTIDNIEQNLNTIIMSRRQLLNDLTLLNPLLARQVDEGIAGLTQYAVEVFHRGRMGVPRFRKEPQAARRAIESVELLLIHAASLAQGSKDQEEIPVLDF